MNLTLWILAALLAALFLASGVMKLARTREQPIVSVFGPGLVRAIGAAEIVGAAGLLIPTTLAPVSAAALALLMQCAFVFHARRRETQGLAVTAALLALTAALAWGRA